MKITKKTLVVIILAVLLASACSAKRTVISSNTLKDALSGMFYIGTAMNSDQITGKDTAAIRVIKQQFDAINGWFKPVTCKKKLS